MTFVVDRFGLVSAAEVDPEELSRAPQALRALSWSGPRLAGALRPTDPRERQQLLWAGMSGIDLKHLLSCYVPYESVRADVLARLQPLRALESLNGAEPVAQAVARARAQATGRADPIGWLPVSGKAEDLVALLDASDGRLLQVARLKPPGSSVANCRLQRPGNGLPGQSSGSAPGELISREAPAGIEHRPPMRGLVVPAPKDQIVVASRVTLLWVISMDVDGGA